MASDSDLCDIPLRHEIINMRDISVQSPFFGAPIISLSGHCEITSTSPDPAPSFLIFSVADYWVNSVLKILSAMFVCTISSSPPAQHFLEDGSVFVTEFENPAQVLGDFP